MAQMRLILTEEVPSLGDAGDVVSVKAGYGRNYLLPQGKAMLATDGRVTQLEHQRRIIEEKERKEVAGHQQLARQVSGVGLSFERQASESGKLFGSVTNADIAARFAEAGLSVERRKIQLPETIKELGEHPIKVRLHRDVIVELKVLVLPSGEPVPEDADEENEPEGLLTADQERDDDYDA